MSETRPRYETICGSCGSEHFLGGGYDHKFIVRKETNMTKTEKELVEALEFCLKEISEHNAEYHHYTNQRELEPIIQLIKRVKES